MFTRRNLLQATGAGAMLMGWDRQAIATFSPTRDQACTDVASAPRSQAILDTLPGKKPLIKLTYRPPNYETPVEYFRTAITPNDAFFVRYHLSNIPEIDVNTWKITVGGEGANAQTEPEAYFSTT